MRKFLLASVAALGTGGMMGAAFAQVPAGAPNMGQTAYPMANPFAGTNNNNNYQAPALPGPVANPTPGTVVVHINARVLNDFQAIWGSADSRPVTPATVSAVGVLTPATGAKTTPYALDNYVRLYLGGDSMATNGLRYGAAIEIRENFPAFSPSNTTSGASAYSSLETLYVRRAFAYFAGENWGILRIGQADGVIGIFDNGVTTGQFLINNWNGGDTQANIPGAAAVPFWFLSQAGSEYDNSKLVYLSPQIAGFDFGLQYAPNASNGYAIGGCGATLTGCPNLSSGSAALDGSRILNQTVVGVRYQGTFGGLGVLAYAAYEYSGGANYTGPTTGAAGLATNFPTAGDKLVAGSSTYNGKYSGLSFGSGGAALTYAGFTLAGNAIGGRLNGQLALAPQGAVPEIAYTASLKYVAGPLTMGVVGEIGWYQGSVQLTGVSQRRGRGIAAGASYALAPGVTVFGEYMYQDVSQSLFNFVTQQNGSLANNTYHSQGFTLGSYINF